MMCLYSLVWEAWDESEAPSFPWLCAFYVKVKKKKKMKGTGIYLFGRNGIRKGAKCWESEN